MKKAREYTESQCPMDGILKILMGPWTTHILWLLRTHGILRFGQLRKLMPGISAKMLTERLRMLEDAGIVLRTHEPTIPPKVSYSFTKKGHDLNKVLDDLSALSQKWDVPKPKRKSA